MATEILGRQFKSRATTVGTLATALPTTALTGRQALNVHNNGPEILYVGHSDVVASASGNGFPIAVGANKSFDCSDGCLLYGRVASGTSVVKSLEGV